MAKFNKDSIGGTMTVVTVLSLICSLISLIILTPSINKLFKYIFWCNKKRP